MNIYLDIDGVLLANEANPSRYANEFIAYVVTRYPTYWLTTHCSNNKNYTVSLLSRFFSEETMKYIRQIKPNNWNENKTEGIDFSAPFLWFDDDLYEEEKIALIKNNVLDNWIEVDLRKNDAILGVFLSSFPIPINTL